MSAIFDSVGYVRRLARSGLGQSVAEAHAGAARDFILAGIATKGDIERSEERVRADLHSSEQRMTTKLGGILVLAVGAIVASERLIA